MDNQNPEYIIFDPDQKEVKSTMNSEQPPFDTDDYIDQCQFSFTNLSNKKTVKLGKYDPEYKHLTVYPGINFKGKCSNPNCKANSQSKKSWIRKGFGKFDMSQARFKNKCQTCNSTINAKTITSMGFTRAKITIDGVMYEGQGDDEKEVDYHHQFEEKEGKFTYFTDYDENMSKWGWMKIIAEEIKK